KGKRHKYPGQFSSGASFCKLCNRVIHRGDIGWTLHCRTRGHVQRSQAQQAGNLRPMVTAPSFFRCDICDANVLASKRAAHANSVIHKRKERYAQLRAAFLEAERDKYGVTVSHQEGLDFGLVDIASLRTQPTITSVLTVMLTGRLTISLAGIRISSRLSNQKVPKDERYVTYPFLAI